MTTTTSPPQATYRAVFANREYRALWLAQLASIAGDQFARVAITVLVYDRTRSPLLTAAAFTCSMLAGFAGGVGLAWLADRYPRRTVMITSDLICAALVTTMAWPGLPVAVLIGLLFAAGLAAAPFASARAATNREVLGDDLFQMGTAITLTTYQVAELAGFAAGGVVTAAAGVRGALFIDAATFGASSILITFGVKRRPAPGGSGGTGGLRILAGIRVVFSSQPARLVVSVAWLAAFLAPPDGLAVVLARELGGGSRTVGLLLTASTAGMTAGALAWPRLVPKATRERWTAVLAIGACATLGLFVLTPDLPAALVILLTAGAGSAFVVSSNGVFAAAIPSGDRGKAFGLAEAGLMAGQGGAILAAGLVAEWLRPSIVIAVFGGAGAVAAAVLASRWTRAGL